MVGGELFTAKLVERSLAQDRPFGDWSYLDNSTWERYSYRLEMLASDFPASKVIADALRQATTLSKYKVIGDPVVRDAINSAVVHYKMDIPRTPLDDIGMILNVAARHLTHQKTSGPLEIADRGLLRIGPAAYHAWVWSEERAENDAFGRAFRRLVEASAPKLTLRTPEDTPQRTLEKGTRLLETLFPQLARSALNHVHVIAVVKHGPGFKSASFPDVMGTIFLSPLVLENPWQAAEFILHEAMHQKFIDLEHTHTIFRTGYYSSPSPTIRPLWNRPGIGKADEWPLHRALTVMHVYTCLAVFFDGLRRRASEFEEHYGPLHGSDPAVSCRKALDRAQYLRHQIKQYTGELGYAGLRFVKWMGDLLDQLDLLPPQPHWTAHLLLDRYLGEAEQVRDRLANSVGAIGNAPGVQGAAPISDILDDMIESEIAIAKRILYVTGSAPLELPASIQNCKNPDTLGVKFALVRDAVFRALTQSAGRPRYYYSCAPEYVSECDETLGSMVECSSEHVNTVLAAVPKNW